MKRRFCFVIDILRWIGGCAGLLFDRRVKKKAVVWLGTSQWALGSNSEFVLWHLSFCHLDQAMVQTKRGPVWIKLGT